LADPGDDKDDGHKENPKQHGILDQSGAFFIPAQLPYEGKHS
jgi:hypothetical protein